MRQVGDMIREFLSNIGMGVAPMPDTGKHRDIWPVIEEIEAQQRDVEARLQVLELRKKVATGIAAPKKAKNDNT